MQEHRTGHRRQGSHRRSDAPRSVPHADLSPDFGALIEDVRRPDAPLGTTAIPDSAGTSRRARLTPGRLMDLQRIVGNHVVSSVVQRVPMSTPSQTETLYNATNAAGQATAQSYGGGVDKYDMTRNGDSGVTVTVRIKFLNQARNSVDPAAPGAPPGTPPLGALLGSPTEIPANDPDNRRAWATDIAARAIVPWQGRLSLVEGPVPAPAAPGGPGPATPVPASPAPAPGATPAMAPGGPPKRLPVTFASVAVFGQAEAADTQIIVHPMSTVAGTPGQPIDAGNYYMNKGTSYGSDDAVIAAHEYGHLLGIPDEYSQSNAQLNALIHQAAPGTAPSAGAALDRASVQRMVLNSLKQPLYDALTAALGPVTAAMRAQKANVMKALLTATKTGVADAAVTNELARMLGTRTEARIAPSIPAAVAFETTRNFSSRSVASGAVQAGFSASGLTWTIGDAYWKALNGAEGAAVSVPGVGGVTIDVAGSVGNMTASGGAQQAPASAIATQAVTGPGPGGARGPGAPGLPAIAPPPNLVSQLTALPATWSTAGSLLETGVTPSAFTKAMVAAMKSADAASIAAAAVMPPGRRRGKSATVGALYRRAYQMVQGTARDAATQVVADLVGKTVEPTLTASVTDLVTSIDAEVNRVMTTPPSGVAALGRPNPNMTALVTAMKTTLDANKAATAGNAVRDPMGANRTGSAPAQDVTYSATGMMGSNLNRGLRADQFQPIVTNFNDKLRDPGEKKFRADTR